MHIPFTAAMTGFGQASRALQQSKRAFSGWEIKSGRGRTVETVRQDVLQIETHREDPGVALQNDRPDVPPRAEFPHGCDHLPRQGQIERIQAFQPGKGEDGDVFIDADFHVFEIHCVFPRFEVFYCVPPPGDSPSARRQRSMTM
jgi:hypothetical protein